MCLLYYGGIRFALNFGLCTRVSFWSKKCILLKVKFPICSYPGTDKLDQNIKQNDGILKVIWVGDTHLEGFAGICENNQSWIWGLKRQLLNELIAYDADRNLTRNHHCLTKGYQTHTLISCLTFVSTSVSFHSFYMLCFVDCVSSE